MNILIIGATSGIGKALFEKYIIEGNRLGIVGRRKNLLDELYQQHPDNTFTFAADIIKQEEIEQAIHTLCTKLKHIDLAIVCSGTGNLNPSLDYALECPAIDTNVTLQLLLLVGYVANQWHLPIVRLKPTRLTTWKLCARRHTKVIIASVSQTFVLVS